MNIDAGGLITSITSGLRTVGGEDAVNDASRLLEPQSGLFASLGDIEHALHGSYDIPSSIAGVKVLGQPRIMFSDVVKHTHYDMPPDWPLFGTSGPAVTDVGKVTYAPGARQAVQIGTLDQIRGTQLETRVRSINGLAIPGTGLAMSVNPDGKVLLGEVQQGHDGDCWYDAMRGAQAYQRPDEVESSVAYPLTDTDKIKAMVSRHPEAAGLLHPSDADAKQLADYVAVEKPGGVYLTHRSLPMWQDKPGSPARPAYDSHGNATDPPALWAAYHEKTDAELKGKSYQSLNGGWPRLAIPMVTGKPVPPKIDKPADMVADVRERLDKGELLAFTTNESKAKDDSLAHGFVGGHTYTAIRGEDAPNAAAQASPVSEFNPWDVQQPTDPVTNAVIGDVNTTVEGENGWYSVS